MRINIVPPSELTDQHLIAEYREIKMLPKALVRTINSKNGLDKKKISPIYTLNKGHGYFFYDKLLYIEKRFEALLGEMQKRGFKTAANSLYDPHFDYSQITEELKNDYIPTESEIEINRERIAQRIAEKPHLYRKTEV